MAALPFSTESTGTGIRPRSQRAYRFLFLVGAVNTCIALISPLLAGHFFDFEVFYRSGQLLLSGENPYRLRPLVPNLNPPQALVFMAPFALVPKGLAWLIWQAANVAALIGIWKLATRAAGRQPTAPMIAVAVALAFVAQHILVAQWSFMLGLLVALAYSWHRGGRAVPAGLSLGLLISIKPFLIPGAVLLGATDRRIAVWMLLGLVAAICAGLWMFPESVWIAWMDGLRNGAVRQAAQPMNSSATAKLLPVAWLPVGTCVGWVVLAAAFARLCSLEKRWAFAVAASILLSPLGWIHYWSWLIAPGLGSWTGSRLERLILVLACTPAVLVAAVPALAGWYCVPLTLFVINLLRPAQQVRPARRDASRPADRASALTAS